MKRIFVVFVFSFLVVWAPALVGATTIIAPTVTEANGSTFTVSISIESATDLTSWQFDLAFDPTIVEANFVTEGPFLSSSGAYLTLFSPGVIDNTSGLISLVTDSYVDLPPGPSGSGDLADINFTALAPGVSLLTLQNVFLNDLDTSFEVTNGQITVTDTAVPEPTTLVLLAIGLALLGGRRLARGARARTAN